MKEFATLRGKTRSCLTNYKDEDKKAKGTKRYAIKRKLKFEDNKNCLEATRIENKINQQENMKLMYIV